MADVRVVINDSAVRAIEGDDQTQREIRRAGEGMGRLAATGAPRDTGRGAASMTAYDSAQANAVDVSWAAAYYYMTFHEHGWAPKPGGPRRPGRYFLRRAFQTYAHF